MKYHTQSQLFPRGNCWQTAIACILDVDADALPPQSEIEGWDSKTLGGWGGYSNCLNGYLRKHHGLAYATVYSHMFTAVRPVRPEHVICGPTVRTAAQGTHHCVVAVNGVTVWDPHPSRAGLLSANDWGLLHVYAPARDEEELARLDRLKDDDAYQLVFGCLCPLCNLNLARERAAALKVVPT